MTGSGRAKTGGTGRRACPNTLCAYTLSLLTHSTLRFGRATETHVQELVQRIQKLENAHGRALTDDTTPQASSANQEPAIPPHDGAEVASPLIPVASNQHRDKAAALTQPTVATPAQSHRYQGPSSGEAADIFPIKYNLGLNWFFNGIPIFSEQGQQWLLKKTGQAVEWIKYRILTPDPSPSLPLSSAVLCQLPDRNVAQGVLALYFHSSFRLYFPVLDGELFEETLQMAYDPVDNPLSSPSHVSARACVLAALCVFSRLEGPGNLSLGVDPSLCSAKARCMFLCVAGDSSLVSLQTTLLLVRSTAPRSRGFLQPCTCVSANFNSIAHTLRLDRALAGR